MTAITVDGQWMPLRLPIETDPKLPMGGSTSILTAQMLQMSSTGYVIPATAAGGPVIGCALGAVDNSSGADGALSVPFMTNCEVYLPQDASITRASFANGPFPVYVSDNGTVTATAGPALAGIAIDIGGPFAIDSAGTFVKVLLSWGDSAVGILPIALSKIQNGLGVTFTKVVALTAGGASGTGDDVAIIPATGVGSIPFGYQVLDATLYVSTGFSTSSATLRTAISGGGTALTSALSTTAAGVARQAITSGLPAALAAGAALWLARTDRSVVGSLVLTLVRA